MIRSKMCKRIAALTLAAGLAAPLASRAADDTNRNLAPNAGQNSGGTPGAIPANPGNAASATDKNAAGSLASSDRDFVMKAANGGMLEVKLGQLATQRAQSEQVKKFGQKMVDDHSKANDELKQLAQGKGIELPADLKGEEKEHFTKFEKATGADFDREYVRMMVEDHRQDLADFKKEAKDGKDAGLRSWAAKTLPTLEEHDKMIEQIASSMGIETPRSASDKQAPDAKSQGNERTQPQTGTPRAGDRNAPGGANSQGVNPSNPPAPQPGQAPTNSK